MALINPDDPIPDDATVDMVLQGAIFVQNDHPIRQPDVVDCHFLVAGLQSRTYYGQWTSAPLNTQKGAQTSIKLTS
jgi:hypothetical protein